ncbi:hypothetical protein LX36DRAFT_123284 [Colletotrichum falcatum]|nr:hypothetical protein LX36DRAFT_123284 [Colletotrichum falcatum]
MSRIRSPSPPPQNLRLSSHQREPPAVHAPPSHKFGESQRSLSLCLSVSMFLPLTRTNKKKKEEGKQTSANVPRANDDGFEHFFTHVVHRRPARSPPRSRVSPTQQVSGRRCQGMNETFSRDGWMARSSNHR